MRSQSRHEALKDLFSEFRRSRFLEARAPSFADVAVEGELRYRENPFAHVEERAIHLALLILEDPQVHNFLCQMRRIRLTIIASHAHQHQESWADLSHDLPIHSHARFPHSLDDQTHIEKSIGVQQRGQTSCLRWVLVPGYSCTVMMDLEEHVAERRELVDAYLKERLAQCQDPLVSELLSAMEYALQGGKRIRAILVMEGAELGGETPQNVLPTAAAVECFHAYSLVHDDLPAMDNDTERRGQPTVHVRFGEATAILVGDSLIPFGFELLSVEQLKYSPPGRVLRAGALFSEALGWRGLTGGQLLDLSRSMDNRLRPEIDRRKTAALFEASLVAGALLAGMRDKQLESLKSFGTQLGLAYQLVDDVLDGEIARGEAKPRVSIQMEAALAALDAFGERAMRLRELTQFLAIRRL